MAAAPSTAPPAAYAFGSDCVKQISFIRHGEAQHNVAARDVGAEAAYGDPAFTDSSLTPGGFAQAEELRAALVAAGTKFDLVIVSPLLRTLQTAVTVFNDAEDDGVLSALTTATGEAVAAPIMAVELVREAYGGHWCDMRSAVSKVKDDFQEVDFSLIATDKDTWHDPDKRETLREVAARGTQFLSFLRALPQRNIAVVSHGVFLETLVGHVLASGDPRTAAERFMNCECRTLVVALPPPSAPAPTPGPHSLPLPTTFIADPAQQVLPAPAPAK